MRRPLLLAANVVFAIVASVAGSKTTDDSASVPFPFGVDETHRHDPFDVNSGIKTSAKPHSEVRKERLREFGDHNDWGFLGGPSSPAKARQDEGQHVEKKRSEISPAEPSDEQKKAELVQAFHEAINGVPTTTEFPPDPRHNGLLKEVGGVGVGFGVGVGVPGNDPVSVATRVGVTLDGSGLAGGLPEVFETIFPRPGEQQSLNDYDGNKDLIVSGKAAKYFNAVRLGWIKIPRYQPRKSVADVNGGIGIGTGTPVAG